MTDDKNQPEVMDLDGLVTPQGLGALGDKLDEQLLLIAALKARLEGASAAGEAPESVIQEVLDQFEAAQLFPSEKDDESGSVA
ncbi:hypothetical protein GCM10028784_02940 [Myceligenerans cantabricum]